ncbi:tyrosine--tRNA ligase MSY1 [Aspergillus mulundensis]|uniref:Tyrosine--tRNA ligase n=1 Tax=Aspergillus mulundensis TaxID=1810919 RepID=A0A3D8S5U9_9EURO|nr:Uncharacterized protein DSM5745_04941 [Aspergillus mulundensis]RDW81384.1 Uncharacterized protein DSM5745_04941 [Aspergillus mulundensis]
MRPRPFSLPWAAHLRSPVAARRPVYGARQYARTAEVLSTNTFRFDNARPTTAKLSPEIKAGQKRWITKKWLAREEEGRKEWAFLAEQIKEGKRKSFVEHLEDRGLIHDVVGERDLLHRVFTEKRAGIYAGIDPTAPSMHVGHMLPFMVLAWGYVWGLPVVFLLGGATARIGDPTGRLQGREEVHSSVRKANMASMHMQLKKLGMSIERYGQRHGYKRQLIWKRALENNNVWWNKTPLIEVLRDLGSYMRLGPMLGRETVKNKMSKGDGMSFAEFTYPLMQAWDWWVLFRQRHTQVQVGGSDQYGNILFGMEAVKTVSKNTKMQEDHNDLLDDIDKPIGFTTPLLTTSSGEKFGKSAGNAIWLDKDMTPTFELYQFFVRTPDDAVERYLKMFTFLPLPEISRIMEEQNQDPSKRVAQHALAYEFVELIHGREEADAVSMQHRQLFRSRSSTAPPTPAPRSAPVGNPKSSLSGFDNPQAGNKYAPQTNFANMPSLRITLPKSLVYDKTFSKILWSAGLVASKSEAQRIINNQGAHVGSRPGIEKSLPGGDMPDALTFTPIKSWMASKTREFIIDDELLILRLGKWKLKLVTIVSDEKFKELGLTAPGWDEVIGESKGSGTAESESSP